MTHRFFVDHTYSGGDALREMPPPPWTDALPAEFRYPYDILEEALPKVRTQGLHFYFTKEAYFLPEYGPHVVPVLLQEERTKVPVYGRYVRAVIRNLLTTPALGFRPHARMGKLEAVLAFEYLRNWFTHLRSIEAQRFPPHAFGRPVREEPFVVRIPLGYHSQKEVPQVPMAERPIDTFFSGEIRHALAPGSYVRYTSSSKFEAREQVWQELNRLQRTGRWNIELGSLSSKDGAAAAYSDYSQKMMHSRICVAPRGTFAESFRAYEGLRAGCLVVANFAEVSEYGDPEAPILFVQHWRELEGILERYARNLDLLEERRAMSLAWWHHRRRPQVLATGIAEALNRAGDTLLL